MKLDRASCFGGLGVLELGSLVAEHARELQD